MFRIRKWRSYSCSNFVCFVLFVCSNFVHSWSFLNNADNEILSKFKLPDIFKFKFDWVPAKMLKGTSTGTQKAVSRKVFIWWSMSIFSFVRYTRTELVRKPDNWRQIYKQTSSTFYASNDVSNISRRNNY